LTYAPSGNPATGAEGLSALMRAEFAAIGAAFSLLPSAITTTGLFTTVFNQVGNFSYRLPARADTLAGLLDLASETTRAEAAEAALAARAVAASSTTPAMDGAAAIGVGTTYARADHIHPTDTSRYATSNPSAYQTAADLYGALAAYATIGYVAGYLYFNNATGCGYQRFPGGLVIQFGVAAIPSGGSANLYFPVTFGNACLGNSVSLNSIGPNNTVVCSQFPSPSGLTLYSATPAGSPIAANVYWNAIGY
jgi:hypothetical protein